MRPVRTRFRSGFTFRLNLATQRNSQAHYAKGTLSHVPSEDGIVLQLLVGVRFQVLFHSPPGVLFTFPSRYSFTIGQSVVFSLTGWSPWILAGLHVSCDTRVSATVCSNFKYGAVTLSGRPFHAVRLSKLADVANPTTPRDFRRLV